MNPWVLCSLGQGVTCQCSHSQGHCPSGHYLLFGELLWVFPTQEASAPSKQGNLDLPYDVLLRCPMDRPLSRILPASQGHMVPKLPLCALVLSPPMLCPLPYSWVFTACLSSPNLAGEFRDPAHLPIPLHRRSRWTFPAQRDGAESASPPTANSLSGSGWSILSRGTCVAPPWVRTPPFLPRNHTPTVLRQ